MFSKPLSFILTCVCVLQTYWWTCWASSPATASQLRSWSFSSVSCKGRKASGWVRLMPLWSCLCCLGPAWGMCEQHANHCRPTGRCPRHSGEINHVNPKSCSSACARLGVYPPSPKIEFDLFCSRNVKTMLFHSQQHWLSRCMNVVQKISRYMQRERRTRGETQSITNQVLKEMRRVAFTFHLTFEHSSPFCFLWSVWGDVMDVQELLTTRHSLKIVQLSRIISSLLPLPQIQPWLLISVCF